jgi:hypothetical protein
LADRALLADVGLGRPVVEVPALVDLDQDSELHVGTLHHGVDRGGGVRVVLLRAGQPAQGEDAAEQAG